MNKQRDLWTGEFGNQYTERNKIDYRRHLPVWREVLKEFGLTYPQLSVLEVGCNRGHNLKALSFLGVDCGRFLHPTGIDINSLALDVARKSNCNVQYGDALAIPFKDGTFNLVFTMGVLIHIAPENLATVMSEIHRVSNRYILAIEYPADEEVMITYRGNDDALWKRDFQKEYTDLRPNLQLIKHWSWGTEDKPFYDRLDGWLFRKGGCK